MARSLFNCVFVGTVHLLLVSCCSLRAGVEITTAKAVYHPGAVVHFQIRNGYSTPVEDVQRLVLIRLERFENGTWRYQPTLWHQQDYEDGLWEIPPCTIAERWIRLPAELTPGTYRLVYHAHWATKAFRVIS